MRGTEYRTQTYIIDEQGTVLDKELSALLGGSGAALLHKLVDVCRNRHRKRRVDYRPAAK